MWVPEIKCLHPYSDTKIFGLHLKVAKQPLLTLEPMGSADTQQYHLQQAGHSSGPKMLKKVDVFKHLIMNFLTQNSSRLSGPFCEMVIAPHWVWGSLLQHVWKTPWTAWVKEIAIRKGEKQRKTGGNPDRQWYGVEVVQRISNFHFLQLYCIIKSSY